MNVVRASGQAAELTVSEVARRVKELIEGAPELAGIWVRGEASNVRVPGSHLYFTLKDAEAQLKVVLFGFSRGKKKPPADGEALLVHGTIRVYERAGEYQLVADDFIRAGVGGLAAQFEALKRKLYEEGLFDESRKLAPPAVPRRIAVVTGLATAALRDVLHVLARRAPYAEVVVFPASVQGDSAPAEIIAALKAADACPDVELILLVRGGGSLEDLWCFNDETLARALAEIKRPVITGVGHEIDFTIVDFVADRRAPTPSAAAELAAPDGAELRATLGERWQRVLRTTAQTLQARRQELERLFDRRLIRDVVGRVDNLAQTVDGLGSELAELGAARAQLGAEVAYAEQLRRLLAPLTLKLVDYAHATPRCSGALLDALRRRLAEIASQLKSKRAELSARDPRAPKKLGFALVWQADGTLLRSPAQAQSGEHLRLELSEGELGVSAE